MRKTILLLLAFLLCSCKATTMNHKAEKDGFKELVVIISNVNISPPGWLIGEWSNLAQSYYNSIVEYKIEYGNIVIINYNEDINNLTSQLDCDILQQSSDSNNYKVEFICQNDQYVYMFRKVRQNMQNEASPISVSIVENGKLIQPHTEDLGYILFKK